MIYIGSLRVKKQESVWDAVLQKRRAWALFINPLSAQFKQRLNFSKNPGKLSIFSWGFLNRSELFCFINLSISLPLLNTHIHSSNPPPPGPSSRLESKTRLSWPLPPASPLVRPGRRLPMYRKKYRVRMV